MEHQKLSPTIVYVLSVLSLLCCCFGGFGAIFAGIAFYIAHSKIKLVQANPEDFEPNSVRAMNTAKIVALIMLIINAIYLIYTLYNIYSIGWDELMERSKEAMEQLQSA